MQRADIALMSEATICDPRTPIADVIGLTVVVPLVVILLGGVFPLIAIQSSQPDDLFPVALASVWAVSAVILASICGHSLLTALRARKSAP